MPFVDYSLGKLLECIMGWQRLVCSYFVAYMMCSNICLYRPTSYVLYNCTCTNHTRVHACACTETGKKGGGDGCYKPSPYLRKLMGSIGCHCSGIDAVRSHISSPPCIYMCIVAGLCVCLFHRLHKWACVYVSLLRV